MKTTIATSLAAALAGAALTFALTRPEPPKSEVPDASPTRAEELRAQLAKEYLGLLVRGVMARDAAAGEKGRNGLVDLNDTSVGPCRDLAVRTTSDDVRLECVQVLGRIKRPEAAAALAEVVEKLPAAHQVVREAAATALARLGLPSCAGLLGKLYRAEADARMKGFLGELYKPYAASDPAGLPDDPALRASLRRSDAQGSLFKEIQAADPSTSAGRARLEEIARSQEVAGLRLPALRRLAERKDAAAAGLLGDVARTPGPDEGGVVRNAALALLAEMGSAEGVEAFGSFLRSPDAALRKPALAAAGASPRKELIPLLRAFAQGDWPEDERQRAEAAVHRLSKP